MSSSNKSIEQLKEEIIKLNSKVSRLEQAAKNDDLFKTLITNTEEIVYVIDKDGTFLLSEGKGLSKLGLIPGEVVGSSVYEIYKELPEMLNSMKLVLQGETISNEVSVGEIYYRNWFTPQLNDNGEVIGLLGLSVNITKQKIAQDQIISEKTFTDAALDAQLDTFFLFEASTGKAIRWNKAFQKIIGYSNEEISNLPAPQSYYSRSDLELASEVIKQVIAEGTGKVELELICKDGTTIPTEYMVSAINDEFDNPLYFISIGRDITERRKIQERINKFSKIFEDSLNEIYLFNSTTFKFTQVNNAALTNLGYSTEEILKITPLDIKPHVTIEKFTKLVNPLINKEKEIIVFETTHERKDGSTYDVEVHLQLIDYSDESIFVAIILDISDKNNAQEELRKHRDHLEELIIERTKELEQKNNELDNALKVFVGREQTIRELQKRIRQLKGGNN